MNVIPGHFVQPVLHDQRQWLQVSAVDHVIIGEWIGYFFQKLLIFYTFDRMSLDSANIADTLLLAHLIALFVIIGDDKIDHSRSDSMVFH